MGDAVRFLPVNTTSPDHLIDYGSASSSFPWWTEAHTSLFTKWASAFEKYNDGFNNPYFEYFFTGQDIQVSIDGMDGAGDILPIYAFGYNIQQQKVPLYGFWSYKYDAMLRGTRIITGAFSVVSMYPYMMTEAIAKAAIQRSILSKNGYGWTQYPLHSPGVDEANIDKFWNKNIDPGTADLNMFSVHPPFNFIIQYGMQETSVVPNNPSTRANDLKQMFKDNDPMMSDTNERLVKNPIKQHGTKILLESIEIISKSIEYTTDGSPLLETYTFMARDERFFEVLDTGQMAPAGTTDDTTDPDHTGLPVSVLGRPPLVQ